MENWRQYREEAPTLNEALTVADLKKLVTGVIKIKKAVEAGDLAAEQGGKLIGIVTNALTGGAAGAVKGAADLIGGLVSAAKLGGLAKTARLPDKETEKAPFLDVFNISDEYSKILDDRLENAFVNHLSDELDAGALDNIDLATWDVNKYLEDWLKAKFNDKAVTGAPANQIDQAKMQQALGTLKKGGFFSTLKKILTTAAGELGGST
jgi:hypothetical protein